MDWQRFRLLWTQGAKARIKASAMVLDSLVWPLIAADLDDGMLVCSETSSSPYAQLLDRDAGIDAIVWTDKPRSIRALAHRSQIGRCYETFTIRSRLAGTGGDTELQKRLRSLADDSMRPGLTLQSYVDVGSERLLGVGVIKSVDLYDAVIAHQMKGGGWPYRRRDLPVYEMSNQADGNQFLVVRWDALTQVKIYPARAEQLALI